MDKEIALVNDGDGIAVIGDAKAVEAFLASNKLESRELGLDRFSPIVANAGSVLQVGSEIAANSGRWIKLTEKSAEILKQGTAMAGSAGKKSEISRAIVTENGKIKHILEFSAKGIANPAVLAGVGGIMAQMAMQQALDEITDYLARIEGKVDDVLRAQKDKVLSELIGIGLIIDDAIVARSEVGRVSETTWSKIQGAATVIATTQMYALRQLDAIAERFEHSKADKQLRESLAKAEKDVPEWLAVIARCFQLDNALGILELDRVLDSAPHEVDDHRRALKISRDSRISTVAAQTDALLERVRLSSQTAFRGVLTHPMNARAINTSARAVGGSTVEFATQLGIAASVPELEERAWREAAAEKRDDMLEGGAEVVDTVREFGEKQWKNARAVAERVIDDVDGKIKDRAKRPKKPSTKNRSDEI